jgi:hypothetical protein
VVWFARTKTGPQSFDDHQYKERYGEADEDPYLNIFGAEPLQRQRPQRVPTHRRFPPRPAAILHKTFPVKKPFSTSCVAREWRRVA